MSESEIKEVFQKVVNDNDLMKQIGATKNQRYNWRNPDRQETKISTMLEVLWKLNMLGFNT